MKLTSWELERVLESLDLLIQERTEEGRGTSNHYRLRNKIIMYAQQTGKRYAS